MGTAAAEPPSILLISIKFIYSNPFLLVRFLGYRGQEGRVGRHLIIRRFFLHYTCCRYRSPSGDVNLTCFQLCVTLAAIEGGLVDDAGRVLRLLPLLHRDDNIIDIDIPSRLLIVVMFDFSTL